VRGGQRGVFIAGADHLIRGNVIANSSSHGVELSGSLATGNRIISNRIGVPAVCSGNCVSRGNGGHGVLIRNSADENRIESNLIAHSGLDGIAVTGAGRNSLRRNTMYDQSGIGIDLGDDGPLGWEGWKGDLVVLEESVVETLNGNARLDAICENRCRPCLEDIKQKL
jgi:parallel beta-helix repeat protein